MRQYIFTKIYFKKLYQSSVPYQAFIFIRIRTIFYHFDSIQFPLLLLNQFATPFFVFRFQHYFVIKKDRYIQKRKILLLAKWISARMSVSGVKNEQVQNTNFFGAYSDLQLIINDGTKLFLRFWINIDTYLIVIEIKYFEFFPLHFFFNFSQIAFFAILNKFESNNEDIA